MKKKIHNTNASSGDKDKNFKISSDQLTVSRMMDIKVRIKRTRNCVKQLVANVRHSSSQQSYNRNIQEI